MPAVNSAYPRTSQLRRLIDNIQSCTRGASPAIPGYVKLCRTRSVAVVSRDHPFAELVIRSGTCVRTRSMAARGPSKKISEMTLHELREISDIELTDKDLAEVIQAIHAGGAEAEPSYAAEPSLDQAALSPAAQQKPSDCLLCQHTVIVPCKDCTICQSSGSTAQNTHLPAVAEWLHWQRQLLNWLVQYHPDTVRCNSEAA